MARKTKRMQSKSNIYKKQDVVVIVVLWLFDLFLPWIYGWLDFSFIVLFGEGYLGRGNFKIYKNVIMTSKCILCVLVSIVVDLKNHKALMGLIGICIASLTPAPAVLAIFSHSEIYAIASLCVYSVFFVVTPSRYVLIFNHIANPSSDQVRKIVAALELMKSLSEFLFFLTRPDPRTFKSHILVVRWVIFISLLVSFVTLFDVVRNKTAPDYPKERTLLTAAAGIVKGIKKLPDDNPDKKKRKTITFYQFIFFIVLLLPVATAPISNLVLLKIEHKLNTETVFSIDSGHVIDYKFYVYLANIVAIPLVVAMINMCKDSIHAMADYLLLVSGHLFNTAVLIILTLIFVRTTVDPNSVAKKKLVQPGLSVITIMEPCVGHDSVDIETPLESFTMDRNIYLRSLKVTFNVSETATFSWKAKASATNRTISRTLIPNRRYLYALLLHKGAIQNILDFGEVTIYPHHHPLLIVCNGITFQAGLANEAFTVYPNSKPSEKTILQLPPVDSVLQLPVPHPGEWTFAFKSPVRPEPLTVIFNLTDESESIAMVADFMLGPNSSKFCALGEMLGKANLSDLIFKTETARALPFSLEPLKGIAGAAIAVGYLQFFWMESPIRFRTTLFSLLLVGEELTVYVIDNFIELTNTSMVTLTTVVGLLAACHVIFGLWYEAKLRKELWYPPASKSRRRTWLKLKHLS